MHPLQCGDLVKQGHVSLGIVMTSKIAQVEKAKQAQAIVAGHYHHIVLGGERGPITLWFGGRANNKTAAMEIHHDWSFLLVSAWRPDVEAQAVLADGYSISGRSIPSCALERSWSELGGI